MAEGVDLRPLEPGRAGAHHRAVPERRPIVISAGADHQGAKGTVATSDGTPVVQHAPDAVELAEATLKIRLLIEATSRRRSPDPPNPVRSWRTSVNA